MEQRIYSTKLFEALRQVRRNYSQAGKVSGGHQVREEKDRVLAVSAKGRSRAILTSRLGMRLGGGNKHKTTTGFREEREICPKAGLRFQRRERKRRTEREEKNGG